MQKAIICSLLFAIPALSFAQSTDNTIPPVKTDYLKKSKNQKTAAWILLGGGFGLATTSVALMAVKAGEDVTNAIVAVFGVPPPPENDYTTENTLLITGAAAMIASIPLFSAAAKNKKRARNMTTNIKMEKATIFEKRSFVQSSYPAFAFKINL
jgi:hypothetical protein